MIYLGDWDHQGRQIENNTRRVLERATGWAITWTRVAITEEQIAERGLEPIIKRDHRYRPPREHEEWEAEALGQSTIVALARGALDALLPVSLADVRERVRVERERVRAILDDHLGDDQ